MCCVLEAPRIVKQPTVGIAPEDTEIQLECFAVALPFAQYRWFRGKQPVEEVPGEVSGARDRLLTFKRARPHHNGQYCCRALNKMGHIFSNWVEVRVIANPPRGAIDPLPQVSGPHRQPSGMVLYLYCVCCITVIHFIALLCFQFWVLRESLSIRGRRLFRREISVCCRVKRPGMRHWFIAGSRTVWRCPMVKARVFCSSPFILLMLVSTCVRSPMLLVRMYQTLRISKLVGRHVSFISLNILTF